MQKSGKVGIYNRSEFASRLRTLIGGESNRRFAKRSGLTVTSVNNYLNGQIPGIDKVIAISNATGTSLEWLASGSGGDRNGELWNKHPSIHDAFECNHLHYLWVKVSFDNMEPTLMRRSWVVVDREFSTLIDGSIYIFFLGGDVLARRARIGPSGQIEWQNDNAVYTNEVYDDSANEYLVNTIGRVVAVYERHW